VSCSTSSAASARSTTGRVPSGLRATEVAPFERDLRVMKICVGAAPLLGLFGTVTGMLATFGALASGSAASRRWA
jgi:biopolymer transport protein ExbB/TolQ